MLVRTWRKGNPPTLLVEMKVGTVTMKNSMEVSQKTKNTIIPLLDTDPDETIIQKDTYTAAKTWKHLMSINR